MHWSHYDRLAEAINARTLVLIPIAGLLVAIGAQFNPAQPQSFDRAYKGIPPPRAALRETR
jgi:hypothetical protein